MKHDNSTTQETHGIALKASALGLSLALMFGALPVQAQVKAAQGEAASIRAERSESLRLTAGKSIVLKLPAAATRVSIGNKEVADFSLLNPREIYLLAKKSGSTNLTIFGAGGQAPQVYDLTVVTDKDALGAIESSLRQLLPEENKIKVSMLGETLVLSGTVSDSATADKAMMLAKAMSAPQSGQQQQAVVNMLNTSAPQQVMLEVKVAEVSKTLLNALGVQFNLTHAATLNGAGWSVLSGFLNGAPVNGSTLTFNKAGGTAQALSVDAQKNDTLVKILAEPTIMSISGQEGTFLSGGKIFIPVPQSNSGGGTTITLEEREFGVGLRATPTVLEGGRINLRVAPEVSQLSSVGTTITSSGVTSVLPTITTRRASTTVQLYDGQSFAIGGLITNNVTETMKAFPGLGEIPIIGALFRSSQFQHDKTELVFVITPHLVKPLPPDYKLPTDNFIEPSRSEFFLNGKLEGPPPAKAAAAPQPGDAPPPAPADPQPKGGSGFEMK